MVEIAAVAIDAAALSTREINALIRNRLAERGGGHICLEKPECPSQSGRSLFCNRDECVFRAALATTAAGLIDGAEIHVEGSAGWGLAESHEPWPSSRPWWERATEPPRRFAEVQW